MSVFYIKKRLNFSGPILALIKNLSSNEYVYIFTTFKNQFRTLLKTFRFYSCLLDASFLIECQQAWLDWVLSASSVSLITINVDFYW